MNALYIGHQKILWATTVLAAAVWTITLYAQEATTPLEPQPFTLLTELGAQTDSSPAAGYEYTGTEMRRVIKAPSTSAPLLYPVDEEGYIQIKPDELPPLEPGSNGLRLLLEYYSGTISLFSNPRKGFIFVPREDLVKNEPLKLRPPGEPTAHVRLFARQAISPNQQIRTDEVIVPAGGRLDFGITLQQDWRVPEGAGATFRIQVILENTTEMLYEETLILPEHFEDSCWKDRTIGLGGYAGQRIRFLFETEPASISNDPDARFAFPLWGNPVLHTEVPAPSTKIPNIVLIALDTLRADRLGCYGYSRPTSPNIDRFAASNIRFGKAFSPSSWTAPTFASLFTGLHPSHHQAGLFHKGFVLDDRFATLAEKMEQTGRITAAYTEGIMIRAQLGFYQGFTVYSDGETPDRHDTGGAEKTFRRAGGWLDKFGHLPFFLFVHTYECHEPYAPPAPWDSTFTDPDYSGKVITATSAVTEADRIHTSNRYDGCIAYTDKWTGWFLEHLETLGLMDTTIVVLFSDHGEEFWEHGGCGHGLTLFDEVLHVPLIIHLPEDMAEPKYIETQVSLADVFATLLELTKTPLPEGSDSTSLLPLINPEIPNNYTRPHVVSELYTSEPKYKDINGLPLEWMSRSLRIPEYKYIVSNKPDFSQGEAPPAYPTEPIESLYNLAEDPGERKNIGGERADQLRQLKQNLLEFLQASEPLADVSNIKPVHVDSLKEEDIQSLQALGYLGI